MSRYLLITCLLLGAGGLLSGPSSSLAQNAPAPSVAWSFDNPENGKVVEHRSGDRVAVKTPYHSYEAVEGVVNRAFRSDGYSTWLDVSVPDEHQPQEALTTEAWVALKSYPVTNAPILNKYTFPEAGYFFGMDPWGQWYLSVSINGEWYTCWARALDLRSLCAPDGGLGDPNHPSPQRSLPDDGGHAHRPPEWGLRRGSALR